MTHFAETVMESARKFQDFCSFVNLSGPFLTQTVIENNGNRYFCVAVFFDQDVAMASVGDIATGKIRHALLSPEFTLRNMLDKME